MNWGLVPELFFDLIGRSLPGSLLLLGVILVYTGPADSIELLATGIPDASAESVLVFAIVGYFIAVVLEQFWTFELGGKPNPATQTEEDLPSLVGIRKEEPVEGTRLLKLQAEKNLCEVLIPGLSILVIANALIIASTWPVGLQASGTAAIVAAIGARMLLLGVVIGAVLALSRWRHCLQHTFDADLQRVQDLIVKKKKQGDSEALLSRIRGLVGELESTNR
jgi:hypothetical protein